jgi:hypothetical protein
MPIPANYPPFLRDRIRKRQGIGVGRNYRPWKGLREGPRAGTAGQPVGIKTGRRHDLITAAHRAYFFLRERLSDVTDIRERFPILSIAQTQELCAAANVAHPASGLTPEPLVIDFLFTRVVDGRQIYEARDLLTSDQEILRVKQAWCERRGVPWSAVDTSGLTTEVLDSLIFVRGWFRHRHQPDAKAVSRLVAAFERIHDRHLTLQEILEALSAKTKQKQEIVHNQFLYAAWADLIPVDLQHRVKLDAPVVLRGRN